MPVLQCIAVFYLVFTNLEHIFTVDVPKTLKGRLKVIQSLQDQFILRLLFIKNMNRLI